MSPSHSFLTSIQNTFTEYQTPIWTICILIDGILDITITAYYYKANEISFFIIGLLIILGTSILNTMNITAFTVSGDDVKLIVIAFVALIPFSILLPLIGYIVSTNNYIRQKLMAIGFGFGSTYFSMGIEFESNHQLSIPISILFQSLPMAILQLIYILNSQKQIQIIYIISFISSMILVLFQSFSIAKSKYLHPLKNYIFPQLCLATDLILLFLTIYLMPIISEIWIYAFIICIISLTAIYSIYIFCRLCFIYIKDFYVAMVYEQDDVALNNHFYRLIMSWQPYYDNNRISTTAITKEITVIKWLLFVIFCIVFIISVMFWSIILFVLFTFSMQFICLTFIPLLLNYLIAKDFINDDMENNEWIHIFQFIENYDNKKDKKLRFISCYQILQNSAYIPLNTKSFFDNLENEEQRILDFYESVPFQRVKDKDLRAISGFKWFDVMRKCWSLGLEFFERFIDYDGSNCCDYLAVIMKYYTILIAICYILSRLAHIILPLFIVYYSWQDLNTFGFVFISFYMILLLFLIKNGWGFIKYHGIMWRFEVFKTSDIGINDGMRIGGYYHECRTIKDRMVILNEYFDKDLANIIEQYIGRKLD